ncbi:Lrp/AsnC family transcriptional regulator [Paenibacillus sp. JMULE4]|uniref:Lrp/AsnC family transcriptional regulator n=1 Tax=Paenibacillus sp. JMULE4 TaxID=2518342 RepID=UPI0015769DC6|nr:Lrp/AsnC family transcriptional regulator [Paenibacillus sp. JMULE4]NTZ19170.1 Lrp/AsnC family transcriptional regulator [Paenibacillus sp. JMULE4]
MPLTKRRLQFLHKLMDLYQKTNLPIHYEALAASLGVSKWTAYDMLKEIEKLGFISRSYEVNTKETGRSHVVFVPTAKASDLFRQSRNETFNVEDWKKTVDNIAALLKDLRNSSLNESIRKMLDEIPKVSTRINFCAYIIGLFLMYLKKLGGKTESLIYHIVQKAPSKETGMTMFVGTVLGTAIQTINDELGLEITELVSKFLQSIEELSGEEKEMLSAFLSEAF